MCGWSAKRRLRIVDFPEPEGPDITIGRWSWVATDGRLVTGTWREEDVVGQQWTYLKVPLWSVGIGICKDTWKDEAGGAANSTTD